MNEETTTSLIDTALAAGSATALDPEERRLQELVLAIRDDAPVPDAGFKLRMDARVAAGFPRRRTGGSGGRIRTLFTTRPQLAALSAVASVLIALAVAIGVTGGSAGGGSENSSSTGSGAASSGGSAAAQAAPNGAGGSSVQAAPSPPGEATEKAAPQSRAVAPASGDTVSGPIAPSPPSGGFVGGHSRKVERSAELVLAPDKDKLSEVADQVIAVTDRYRGFVMNSSVTSSAGQGSTGSFDLRIPARNLRLALRDLSALADVKSRTENANDITASFVNARTRLEELTAERRGLLRRLERATTDRQAAAIRARMRIVNAQIESQTSALNDLRRRSNYAAVSVTLEPKTKSTGGGIGSGARDLRDSLIAAANIALRVLGVALPIAILIALLWAGSGWFSRRRREAVLDAPRAR